MTAMPERLHAFEIATLGDDPRPLLREVPNGEPYPVKALGPLREVVEAVHDISQAPVAIAAQSALSVASLGVQGFADVETLGGDAPCSLFCLTIAESGERKSTCDRLLMSGVRDRERTDAEAYASAFADYELARGLWEGKRKRFMAAAAGLDKSKAATAESNLRNLGPAPCPPLFPNMIAMEPTFEGLQKLYGIGRPSLGLFSDEAGGFIGGHAMNSDNRLKTMAGLSRLWNGEPIDRTRAGDGATAYRGRRLAMHLMAQPVVAHLLLTDRLAAGQGFNARFLITEPPSAIGYRLRRGHTPASDAAVDAFSVRLKSILETPMPTGVHRQELAPRRLLLSPEAKELLWRFHEAVEQAQAPTKPMEHVRAYASKSMEQAARIAGVLTLWADLEASEVAPQAMGCGVKLAQFYLSEAKRLAEAGPVSDATANADMLRIWLLEVWPHDVVTPSEILRNGPNSLRERTKLNGPLSMLVTYGWLIALPRGTEVRAKSRDEAYQIVRPINASV